MFRLTGLFIISIIMSSCNNSGVDNSYQDTRPVCGENKSSFAAACSPPMPSWSITVKRENFPENFSLILNDHEVINECTAISTPFIIDRDDVVTMEAKDFFDPGDLELKVTLVDLGSNCLESTIFYSSENQEFTISGEERDRLLEITIE